MGLRMSLPRVYAPLLAALLLTLGPLLTIPITAEAPPQDGEVRSGDPVVYEVSTFLGGANDETITDGAVDDSGFIYLVGTFRGLISPTLHYSYSSELVNGSGTFVAKMAPGFDDIVYCALFNGSGFDRATSIAVDDEGRAIVVGYTNSQVFPVTEPCELQGVYDCFVMRLNPSGTALEHCFLFGGELSDQANDVALDPEGNAIIVGETESSDFISALEPAYDPSMGGASDAFLSVVDWNGSLPRYSTYFGGEGSESAEAIHVDGQGHVYLTGITTSEDFPLTEDAMDNETSRTHGGTGVEGFVTRFDRYLYHVDYSTFIGGSWNDWCHDIWVDEEGCAYVVGESWSGDFPVTGSAYDWNRDGSQGDGFVSKIGPDGRTLLYSTYLGGSQHDEVYRIDGNGVDSIVVTGWTQSSTFPFTAGVSGNLNLKDEVVFVTHMDLGGPVIAYSALCGLAKHAVISKVLLSSEGDITCMGMTKNRYFTTTNGSYQEEHGGGYDGVLFRIPAESTIPSDTHPPVADAGDDQVVTWTTPVELNGSVSTDDVGIKWFAWEVIDDGGTIVGRTPVATVRFEAPGTHEVLLYVVDESGNWDVDNVTVEVRDVVVPVARSATDIRVEPGVTAVFDASGSTDDFGIMEWTWDLSYNGTHHELHGPVVEFQFHELGEYPMVLTVADVSGNTDSLIIQVTVWDITHPVADAGDDLLVEVNETFVLDGTGSTDNVAITNWTWYVTFYDGNTTTLYGPVHELSFDQAGLYRIMLHVEDPAGHKEVDDLTVNVTGPATEGDGQDVGVDEGFDVPWGIIAIIIMLTLLLVLLITIDNATGGGEIRL